MSGNFLQRRLTHMVLPDKVNGALDTLVVNFCLLAVHGPHIYLQR
jgi:hypothetical protein